MYASGIALLAGVGAVGSLAGALTASNTVPATNLLTQVNNPTLPVVAPVDCNSIVVTTLFTGLGATLNGGATADFILGGPAAQTIGGKNGDDCILGGAGNDAITGGAGTDICSGGPGTDTFVTCEVTVQ
jgi:Ca2+-binding RTX toxin-like protein